MAIVLSNARVDINGVNLSAFVRSVTLNLPTEQLESTTMGDVAREKTPGLKDASVDIVFVQSFQASEVDATLFPLRSSSFAVAIRPVNTTISATNPEYQFTGVLENYTPVAGGVGVLHEAPVRILAITDVIRDTTP